MTQQDVVNQVCQAVALAVEKDPRDIHIDQALVADLGFDSLRMVSLMITLEDSFGRCFLLNEWVASAENSRKLTVGCLSHYVRNSLQEMSG